jgi:uncharacterized membrane protein YkvA (DUF1232 family)
VRTLLVSAAIALVIWLVAVAFLVLAGRRSAAKELATLLPNLLHLFRGLFRDPRVPRGTRALVLVAVIWIASPLDLIPEFVPVAGPLDDAIVAALVLRRVLRSAGREVVAEHWRGEPATLERIIRLAGRSPQHPRVT